MVNGKIQKLKQKGNVAHIAFLYQNRILKTKKTNDTTTSVCLLPPLKQDRRQERSANKILILACAIHKISFLTFHKN